MMRFQIVNASTSRHYIEDMVTGRVAAQFEDPADAQTYADAKNNADPGRYNHAWLIVAALLRSGGSACDETSLDPRIVAAAEAWLKIFDPYPKPAPKGLANAIQAVEDFKPSPYIEDTRPTR